MYFPSAVKFQTRKHTTIQSVLLRSAHLDGFLMPDELIRAMLPEGYNINSEVLLSTEWDSKEAEITQQLNSIVSSSHDLQMRTLRDSINNNTGMYNTLLTSIIGISIFIMMFSLISLINTLVTNIMTRKQELSVLQSIGMTTLR